MSDEVKHPEYRGCGVYVDARPLNLGPKKPVQRGAEMFVPAPAEDQAPIPAHQPRGVKKPIARGPVMFIPKPLFSEY